MNKKIIIPIIIIIVDTILTTIFYSWWYANAPYCCTHICGATYSMMECWGQFMMFPFVVVIVVCLGWIVREMVRFEET